MRFRATSTLTSLGKRVAEKSRPQPAGANGGGASSCGRGTDHSLKEGAVSDRDTRKGPFRSIQEEQPEIFQKAKDTESTDDMSFVPIVEVPHSVKNILNKIDTAQLERAKKDISKKLHHIQNKVHRAYEHYKKDDGFDPVLEKEYLHTATWEEKSRRSNLLDEIADSLDQSAFKEKELQTVLESLKAWSDMMKTIELQEKVIISEDWIEEAEKKLLKHFHAVQKNILHLIKMCYPILQERERMRRKSAVRVGIFKAWRDKVAAKPDLAEPLTAAQMVEDEVLTYARTNEVTEMILELADLSFFNKGEVNAIRYIAALVANLTKAFGLLTRQCRSLKIKLEVGAEDRRQDPKVTSLQRELRMIIEKKAALELQIHNAEERCKVLLTTNEAMQRELQSAHERAQMKKPFSRSSLSKVPEEKAKPEADDQKDVSKTKPVKQLQPSAMPGMETEEPSSLETRKLKYESEDESSVSSLSLPEEGGEQPMAPKHRKLSKQRLEQLRKVQAASQDQQKQQRKREGSSKYPHPKEEKLFHLPEVVLWVQDEKSQGKELQQTETQSSLESESEQGHCLLRLQERLEWEKERLQEEQLRLQEERLRLDEEVQSLEHWQHLFEMQQEQWEQQQHQQQEQEWHWNAQLEHWQQLKQDHEAQQQYWWLQEKQHQERLHQMQEELQKMQQQYEEQLLLQKEQTEEKGRWEQLHAWRKEQLQAWQEEEEEQEKQRSQWEQQLADHEKQLRAWQQEKAVQEVQYKNWQEEQQQQLQEQERLWKQRCQQLQQRWRQQVQRHQIQQSKRQTQQQKVQERQRQIQNEEKILAPKLKMLRTRDDGFPAPSITEKRYSLNVEAQRKNLELLEEANQKTGLASDVYIKAKDIITQVLHSNVERLALLFQKYIAFRRLQAIRQILTAQLDAAKDDKDGAKVQKLYRFVERLDAYQVKVLENWRTGQRAVEKKRQHNIENMIDLFAQLRLSYQLQLSTPCPLMTKAAGIPKETHPMPHIGPVYMRPKVYRSPLFAVKKPIAFSAIIRYRYRK
uniref:protein FAM186A n=1 Tax=Euleptes europaea TaxID=460621 RepID=UPI002541435D|nr:protein FAM186A [Euleptes europaea]